jgi:CRISPR/Cas system CSM-associated protein Csm3 (group 7 of RAMP superfamily)
MSANPRRVERVLPDNKFNYEMIFNVEALTTSAEEKPTFPEEKLRKDLNNLLSCMEIIQSEGIGGYVSRGYGKIEFTFTEFCARSLDFFRGNTDKITGKTSGEFSIAEARKEVENIINFLKEEA